MSCLEGGEAVPGTTVKARPTVSTQALARADTAGSAGSDASHANSNYAFSAALAEAASDPEASLLPSNAGGHSDSCAVKSGHSNQQDPGLVSQTGSVPNPAEVDDDSAVVPQGSIGKGTASPAAEVDTMDAGNATTSAEQVPVVAEEGSDPDCIGNPLYEEPDPVRPVPAAELALQPALQPAHQPAQEHAASEVNTGPPGPSSCPDEGAPSLLPCCTHV